MKKEVFMEQASKSGFSRLIQIAGNKKKYLTISAFFAVASSVFALTPYIIIYLVMTKMLVPESAPASYRYIIRLSLAGAGAMLLRYLFLFVSIMFSHVAAFNILYELRSGLAGRLGKLPMGYFTGNQTGKIKKILYEDVEEIELFIAHHIPDIVSGIVIPVAIVGYLFTVDWRMALVSLVPIPLAFIMQQKTFDKDGMNERRKKYHDALENMNGTIVEYIRGMPVIKIFNQNVESFKRLKEAAFAYTGFIREITLSQAPLWAVFITITSSGLFFILPSGILLYMKNFISLPELFLFLMIGSGYMAPLFRLAMLGGQLGNILEGLSRVDEILESTEIEEPENGKKPDSFDIEFRNVSFGYGNKKVLRNISFKMREGNVHALVGPSGAGKTTVAQLILRMWDIDEGEILIGGVNIKDISRHELMNLAGFVFQDVFIFSDTVYENIRMGMENVSDEDIERAAEVAQCSDFIDRLPKGFKTRIGEGGEVHLSGGEKQRISLARVILKNAPIVILDEATAYADAENESRIQTAFSEIMKNKTVIVIAHRLSTITDADEIIVIRDGIAAERGSHEKLLEKGLFYHDMWQAHTAAQSWTLSV